MRWCGEPVRAVILPTDIFLVNPKGYPVLPKRFKTLLLRLFRNKVQVIIREEPPSADVQFQLSEGKAFPSNGFPLSMYHSYVAKLYQSIPDLSQTEKFEYPYWDFLQSPLQPLQDNLESQTYETFEKDPVKYVEYERAILACINDRKSRGDKRHVIMVVGAGRGPLVQASLNALQSADINDYSVYAIEKNENAIISLKGRVEADRNSSWRNVYVIECDMRHWKPNELADILVSELLGSFGDNELSPECLDGAQRYLKVDGVSIPSSYYSSVEPISSSKLWGDCRVSMDTQRALETAYVVKINAAYHLGNEEPQKCFEFSHPNWSILDATSNKHNARYSEVNFTSRCDGILHGFAGYFHCTLYKDISLSIIPQSLSVGMFSWFPLFIPLKEPVTVREGDPIRFHLWRDDDCHKVWYEWCISEPVSSQIQNPGGRSYFIGK